MAPTAPRWVYRKDGSMHWRSFGGRDTPRMPPKEYLACMLAVEPVLLKDPACASRSRVMQALVKDHGMSRRNAMAFLNSAQVHGILAIEPGPLKWFPEVYVKGPNWHKTICEYRDA